MEKLDSFGYRRRIFDLKRGLKWFYRDYSREFFPFEGKVFHTIEIDVKDFFLIVVNFVIDELVYGPDSPTKIESRS